MAGHHLDITIKSGPEIEGIEIDEEATEDLFPGMSPSDAVKAFAVWLIINARREVGDKKLAVQWAQDHITGSS